VTPRTATVCEFYMRWPLPAKYQRAYDEKYDEFKQEEGDEKGIRRR